MEKKDKKKETKKKGMNLPNKITCVRLVISLIVLVILCFPWDAVGISKADRIVGPVFGVQNIDLKFIIAGILFAIGSVTDFLDGYIARKYNIVTDFGKVGSLSFILKASLTQLFYWVTCQPDSELFENLLVHIA